MWSLWLWACTGPKDGETAHTGETDTPDPFVVEQVDAGNPGTAIGATSSRRHETITSLIYTSWEQATAGSSYVEFEVAPGEWLQSPARERAAGAHEELLLGIPYDTEASWRVVVQDADGTWTGPTYRGATGPLPADFLQGTVITADDTRYEPSGTWLYTSINRETGGWRGGEYWQLIVDRQGRVVWALMTPDEHWTIYVRTSGNDLLWEEQTYWADWDKGLGSMVHRMKIDGTVLESISTPGLHHAFTELPDGTLAWGAATKSSETLDVRDPDGTIRTIWSCEQWFKGIGYVGSCQSNSLWYFEAGNSFLYSFYTTSTAVEVDYATGENLRQWGRLGGSYVFDPKDSVFDWQHGLTYTEAGTLLLSTRTPHHETAVREYVVDDKAQALHQLWEFGEGEGVYAATAGEAHRLPNGNTLHNYGSGSRVREITPELDVVWDLAWEPDRLLGRSIFLEDLYTFAPEEGS